MPRNSLRCQFFSRASSPIRKARPRRRLFLDALEDRFAPAVISVSTTADVVDANDGFTSLREAILAANDAPSKDTIAFDIAATDAGHSYYLDDGRPGLIRVENVTATTAGDDAAIADIDPDHPHSWWTIAPTSDLPTITDTLVIDGYTQADASPNSNGPRLGGNAVLQVELSGIHTGGNGLVVSAGFSTVRGLTVNRFGTLIYLGTVGSNVVEGNYLGTDVSGSVAAGAANQGVLIGDSSGNLIGGSAPAARNVISGSLDSPNSPIGGIAFFAATTGNRIQGNFIGTNAGGTMALGNRKGIEVNFGAAVVIGGSAPGEGNLISGNTTGVLLSGGGGTLIQGNFIGTDVTGTLDLGNNWGIFANSSANNTIGGATPGAGNVISGNSQRFSSAPGIELNGGSAGNLIQGNFIGTQADGVSPLGNANQGVYLVAASNTTVMSNIIAFNATDGRAGLQVGGGAGNRIVSNSIHSHSGLGIDLSQNNAVNANDAGDVDAGSNNGQNFPVLTAARSNAAASEVAFTLNSVANAEFLVEFFANEASDPSGHGEGRTFVGATTQTTDNAGNVSFTAGGLAPVALGQFITATATNLTTNDTSEFSANIQVVAAPSTPDLAVIINAMPESVAPADNITYMITVTNNGPVDATNVTLNDAVPAHTTFVSFTPLSGGTSTTPAVGGGGAVTSTTPSLAAGASLSFALVVLVNPSLDGGTIISNSAVVSGSANDPNTANNTADAAIAVQLRPTDLRVTLSDVPDPVLIGGTLTYTITVTNAGPVEARAIFVRIETPAHTTFQSLAAPAGWIASTPAAGATGAIRLTNVSLPAGASATFVAIVQVDQGLSDGTVLNNGATVSSSNKPNEGWFSSSATVVISRPVVWNTDLSGLWTDPDNWDGGIVPKLGDNVIIDRPGVDITVRIPDGDFSIGALTSKENIVIDGDLTIKGASQLSNVDVHANAKLVIDTAAPVGITGDWNNAGRLSWIGSGSLGFTNGARLNNLAGGTFEIHTAAPVGAAPEGAAPVGISFSGGGSLNNLAGGVIQIDSAAPVGIGGGNLNNAGRLSWNGSGQIALSNAAQLNNLAGALFEILQFQTAEIVEEQPLPRPPVVPDDTAFPTMWGLDAIRATEAWAFTRGSTKTTIAVVDTGVDYTHPDLYLNIWINQDEIPGNVRQRLTDVDDDGLITFRDLNYRDAAGVAINQGRFKANDVNNNGYIDGGDLIRQEFRCPIGHKPGEDPNDTCEYIGGWANGTDEGANGYTDDLIGWNFQDDTNNPLDHDSHGTHVAGTIGAVGNNSLGVTGINWNTQIMALRIKLEGGEPPTFEEVALSPGHYLDLLLEGQSEAIDAVNYAAANGARVSNHSWGATMAQTAKDLEDLGQNAGLFEGFDNLKQAISNAAQSGHMVVMAAGNDGINIDNHPSPPGDFNVANMITVANTTHSDDLAFGSNFGRNKVDLAAPGSGILSTLPVIGLAADSDGYGHKWGTSMAAPHVTGVIGLVLAQHPDWSYQQIIRQVLETVERLPDLEGKVTTGGRLNALGAVAPNPWIYSPSSKFRHEITASEKQVMRVTLNKPIKPSTFTTGDVTITKGQALEPVSVTGVQVVPGSGNRQFDVHFDGSIGAFTMTIGAGLQSFSGYFVDSDHDGIGGEAIDDRYIIQWTANPADISLDDFPIEDVARENPVAEISLASGAGLTNFPGGTIAINTIHAVAIVGGPFTNDGAADLEAGALRLGDGSSTGSFRVDAGAALNFAGSYSLNAGTKFAGGGSLNNLAGSVIQIDSAAPVGISGDWNNAGRLRWIGSGSLGFTNGAHLNNLADGIFEIHTADPVGIAPTTLAFDGGGRLHNRSGGVIEVDHPPRPLNPRLARTSHSDIVTLEGRIDNEGTLAIRAGTLTLSDGALVNNQASGLIRLAPDTFMSAAIAGAGRLHNLAGGVIEVDPAAPVGSRIADLNNQGTVVVRAGNLDLGNGSSTGSFRVDSGAALNFTGDYSLNADTNFTAVGDIRIDPASPCCGVAVNGSVGLSNLRIGSFGAVIVNGTLSSDTPIRNVGGTLSGTGTIRGNVINSGRVTPGNSPGTLTIDGDYTQSSTGVLDIEIGGLTAGSQYDQLNISGAAVLDGTLDTSFVNGFTPSASDGFAVIKYGSHTGNFAKVSGPLAVTLETNGAEASPTDTIGPTVLPLTLRRQAQFITDIALRFSEELLEASAVNASNYRLVSAGRDKLLGTPDDVAIALARRTYDPVLHTVTLTPARRLKTTQALQLTVNGTASVTDLAGNRFDGDADGSPGGNFVVIVGTKISYLDHDSDRVSLSLGNGGLMQLTRRPDGEGQDLRVGLLGTVTQARVLSGGVKSATSGGSDHCTTLRSITGLGLGTRRLPRCTATSPGFQSTTVSAMVVDALLIANELQG